MAGQPVFIICESFFVQLQYYFFDYAVTVSNFSELFSYAATVFFLPELILQKYSVEGYLYLLTARENNDRSRLRRTSKNLMGGIKAEMGSFKAEMGSCGSLLAARVGDMCLCMFRPGAEHGSGTHGDRSSLTSQQVVQNSGRQIQSLGMMKRGMRRRK